VDGQNFFGGTDDMMDFLSQRLGQFNRFELKYLISMKQAEAVKVSIRKDMAPDTYGNRDGRYTIANLYYDSPDFCCYWEKEHGIKSRRKLRIRHYETDEVLTENTLVFLEIKQRIDRVTQKRRVALPYFNALQLCNDRYIPEHDPQAQTLIEEIFVMLWRYQLVPSVIVRYDRQAFIGSIYDAGMRVTFDTDLTYQAHPLRLHEKRSELLVLSPGKVILEIKINNRMPRWLTELIAAHNLQLFRISKYCCSVKAAWQLLGSKYRQPFAEGVRETLFSAYSIPLFWSQLSQSNEKSKLKEK
jgi:hypothetical protein